MPYEHWQWSQIEIDNLSKFKENVGMSFKYKNVSELDQSIDGYGIIKAGEEFTAEVEVYNKNFELVGSQNESAHIPVEQPKVEEPVQSTDTKQEDEEGLING